MQKSLFKLVIEICKEKTTLRMVGATWQLQSNVQNLSVFNQDMMK